jgi:hypothetical protein
MLLVLDLLNYLHTNCTDVRTLLDDSSRPQFRSTLLVGPTADIYIRPVLLMEAAHEKTHKKDTDKHER